MEIKNEDSKLKKLRGEIREYRLDIHAARVLLSTFGLTLEEKEHINLNTILNIYDSNNAVVGRVYLREVNEEAVIARIDCPTSQYYVKGNISTSSDNPSKWQTNISYVHAPESDSSLLKGNIVLAASNTNGLQLDNLGASAHYENDAYRLDLIINQNNATFNISLKDKLGKYNYYFNISCASDRYPSVRFHQIDNYTKQASQIIVSSTRDELIENMWNTETRIKYNFPENNIARLILLTRRLYTLAPDAQKLINKASELLTIEGLPFFQNLLAISYPGLSDEEVKRLIGVERPKIFGTEKSVPEIYFASNFSEDNNLVGSAIPLVRAKLENKKDI